MVGAYLANPAPLPGLIHPILSSPCLNQPLPTSKTSSHHPLQATWLNLPGSASVAPGCCLPASLQVAANLLHGTFSTLRASAGMAKLSQAGLKVAVLHMRRLSTAFPANGFLAGWKQKTMPNH